MKEETPEEKKFSALCSARAKMELAALDAMELLFTFDASQGICQRGDFVVDTWRVLDAATKYAYRRCQSADGKPAKEDGNNG